jgi:hypothetical protein
LQFSPGTSLAENSKVEAAKRKKGRPKGSFKKIVPVRKLKMVSTKTTPV